MGSGVAGMGGDMEPFELLTDDDASSEETSLDLRSLLEASSTVVCPTIGCL